MEARSFAGRCKQILGGLVAAVLLLPVPAYAAITFTGDWNSPSLLGSPIASATPDNEDTAATSIVIVLNDNVQYTGGPVTVTFERTLTVDGTGGDNTLNGGLNNFNKLYSFGTGSSVLVSAEIEDLILDVTNNMFTETYNSGNAPATNEIFTQQVLSPSSYIFRVSFTFQGPFYTNSTPITLNLNN